jgi:hypothetical protein
MKALHRSPWRVAALVLAAVACGCAKPAAPAVVQRTFESPAAAAAALFDAIQKDDQVALLAVFGPAGRELIQSGDPAEDKDSRAKFIEHYQKMHRIGLDANSRTALVIGAENWPFPIPLVNKDGTWSFDTEAGKREVLYRRVGRNEEDAIQICQQLVQAQREYFAAAHDGDTTHQYAQHFVSTPGHHDGLFWQDSDGGHESPIGPLLAFAGSEVAAKAEGAGRVPFHGYYFRILKAQGKDMPGGAKSFIVNNRMTGGFGFVAYPAEYRSSGVMTFVVGPDGTVYQFDLGADGATRAKAMTELNHDANWSAADADAGL